MAPEQAYSADTVDVRADLYSVGVMMYEMLSGRTPVQGEDPRVLVLKVERGEVEPLVNVAPGIQPQLAGFVHRAMAPRPDVRFANATEMRLALEAITQGKKGTTAPLQASVAPMPPMQASIAPRQPPVQASFVPAQGSFVPMPYADTADARDNKTGTVMGAPVDPSVTGPKTNTVAGAPIDAARYASDRPPAMAMNQPTPYEPSRPPKRGSGLVIGLAIVATLLGAGAVVTYVMSTGEGRVDTTPTAFTSQPPPTTPATTTTTGTPPATAVTTATPLKPSPPQIDPSPNPKPKVDAGAQPHADAGGGLFSSSGGPLFPDAGAAPAPSQTTFVTPFGTFQYPGPRPPLYPADQPWPPPWVPPPQTPP
jgi:serine/threonine-protein kinase